MATQEAAGVHIVDHGSLDLIPAIALATIMLFKISSCLLLLLFMIVSEKCG